MDERVKLLNHIDKHKELPTSIRKRRCDLCFNSMTLISNREENPYTKIHSMISSYKCDTPNCKGFVMSVELIK